jgi:hypothetical protein
MCNCLWFVPFILLRVHWYLFIIIIAVIIIILMCDC